MRKIAIGNSVYVNMNDCTIEIDRIEINSAISTSFNFNIVRDGTTIKTVSFPLSNQTLNAGDYLNAFGINRVGSDVTEEYTAAQAAAFKSMTNLNISKGGFTVSLSNTNAILKLYYYSNREIDEQIYVLNKHEELIAVFNKNDEDPIFNPRIRESQNAESVLTFSISPNNPKWEQIKNPENLYVTEGKMFSTNFEGCFEEFISASNEDYISVTAYERQKLLSRRYVKAWNSETGFDGIDTFMVVVLSGGELELKNGYSTVDSKHPKGSSGYALDALLYGTGWTTGTCDVEGTFDLETDQIDIYENILKVQQIWGGILVFDSLNKIVHHRDETKWLPYNGYEVRYQKNMQSLEKLYNNKIVTQLCPLGESGLNIKSVNNGSEWLTNYTYTDTILQGIENNPDITDPEQLMRWGERKLKDLCKPRKELTVEAILLYQVEGYELEEIALNHIVDVINFAGSENDIEQLRVVGYEHGVWDYSDAVLELSDITLESTDIFKKTVSATNSINDGTLDSRKVVNFYKNGESISESFKRVDRTLIDTKSELLKADDEITARVTQVRTDVNDLSNQIVGQEVTIAEHTVSIGKIEDRVYNVEEVSNTAVKDVKVYYASGDSPTTAPTDDDDWDTKAPPWENGRYMWQKTVTTYVSGTVEESKPTNITGAKGATGAAGATGKDGLGIKQIEDQYYLSDSDTTQTGGEWKETQDSWEENKYIWTRTKVTWIDGSITYTDPVLATTLNDLSQDTKYVKTTLAEQVLGPNGLVTTVAETTRRLNEDYLTANDVNQKIGDVDSNYTTLLDRVTTVETTANGVDTRITTIENNGVDKVSTTTGYTFNQEGLTIEKTNKEMSTQITEDGMTIYRDKGKDTEEKRLIANSTGVYAYDLHAKTYLIVGESSRFEDYTKNGKKRTGCFWVGETEV